jgi:hypothetical protein
MKSSTRLGFSKDHALRRHLNKLFEDDDAICTYLSGLDEHMVKIIMQFYRPHREESGIWRTRRSCGPVLQGRW